MRVLVTGGRSEIGDSVYQKRISLGDDVALTSSTESNEKFFNFDFKKPEESIELKKWIDAGIDCLVLNAFTRVSSMRRFHEFDANEVRDMFTCNIEGNFWLLKQVLPIMKKQNFGRIVFISSMTVKGAARYSLYSAAKYAIEGLMHSIASDYGEFNVTANIVRPGIIQTERTKRFWQRTNYDEKMKQAIPLMRFGMPSDISNAVNIFLDKNCYSTSSVLEVAGGLPQVRPEAFLQKGIG